MLLVNNISKIYTDQVGYKINLYEDINLKVSQNEFVALLAPKGAGKTSLLKAICGLDELSSGNVKCDEKRIFIPSEASSFPWLTVSQNIEKVTSDKNKISELINFVGLNGYEDHFPNNKSLGFRFRISLARALAVSPKILVIDEPFNNLKSESRKDIYSLLKKVNSELGISILLGTTNITEAIFLADRINLMQKNPGKIIDVLSIENRDDNSTNWINSAEFLNYRNKIETILQKQTANNFHNFSL